MKRKFTFILAIAFLPFCIISKSITLSGSVFGFLGEKVLLMRKASKNVSFEGPLTGASIVLTGNGINQTMFTDITGTYSVTLKEKGAYKLQVKMQGYSLVSIMIMFDDEGLKTHYPALSFILKKDDNSDNNLGELLIENSGKLTFNPNTNFKSNNAEVMHSNTTLLDKAALINNSSATNIIRSNLVVEKIIDNGKIKISEADTVIPKQEIVSAHVVNKLLSDTVLNADSLRSYIDKYKTMLAQLKPGEKNYSLLKAQIVNAENKLQQDRSLIALQKQQLLDGRKKIMFVGLFAVFALLSMLLLLFVLRQRKKHVGLLDEKNKNITRINGKMLSSIRYAATMQTSLFKDKKQLNQLFKNAFIYNQPKDILSGDFYWFAHKNGHKIAVVADCTGHGVPGALLTILGNNILEDVVHAKGEIVPSKILMALSQAVVAAFSHSNELEYGMDITIMSCKEGSDEMMFSGITNGLYHCANGELKYIPVTPKTIGPELEPSDLKDKIIRINKGDCFYMLSDGYADQFGGQTTGIEKYNVLRLAEILKRLSKESNFLNSENLLKTEFETWKGKRDQIDDVMVLGIRFD